VTNLELVFSALTDWRGRGATDEQFDAAFRALRVLVALLEGAGIDYTGEARG
jgi:hypothetical protein